MARNRKRRSIRVGPLVFGLSWTAVVIGAVVLVIGLAALIPTRATEFASHASPATSYADAVNRIVQRQEADDRVAVPAGRSVLLTHGARTARVVVLFHGFTNSPRQYEHLAGLLHARGDNVYIPRLPHHAERGGRAATLAQVTAEDLRGTADSAVDAADGLGDSVIVAGVSAGGTIAAWLAQNRQDVHRAVIIAPLLEIGRLPSFFDNPLMNFALRAPNVTRNEAPDSQRPDRELGVASRGVAQILRLGVAVRRAALAAPPRTREIVFVTNASDHTVRAQPVLALARRWNDQGAHVVAYQFPRSLGLPHDIAEEAHPNARPDVVYPALIALIHGEPPPKVLGDNRVWPP